jgi:hypothetical protein
MIKRTGYVDFSKSQKCMYVECRRYLNICLLTIQVMNSQLITGVKVVIQALLHQLP